jgi:hypothetical protein
VTRKRVATKGRQRGRQENDSKEWSGDQRCLREVHTDRRRYGGSAPEDIRDGGSAHDDNPRSGYGDGGAGDCSDGGTGDGAEKPVTPHM